VTIPVFSGDKTNYQNWSLACAAHSRVQVVTIATSQLGEALRVRDILQQHIKLPWKD